MNTIQTTEYAVHLLQQAANGTKKWRAFIETLPQVTAEGESCEAVLEEIGRKLQMTLANGESANAPAASGADDLSQQELARLEAQVQAQGHKFYGIFADDPGALEVLDRQEAILRQVGSGFWPEEPDIPEAPIASSVKEFLLSPRCRGKL